MTWSKVNSTMRGFLTGNFGEMRVGYRFGGSVLPKLALTMHIE